MKSVQGCSVLRQYQSAIFRAGRVASDQEASNAWAMRKPIPSATTIPAIASSIKRPRARSSSVTEDPSAQSKEFDRAVEVRVAPEDFQQQSFSVAARQLNFCFCYGTTHFDLRRAQRGLSFTHRGWVGLHSYKFSNPASRSAKTPAAFYLEHSSSAM
jgi:hypothetical protein